MFDSSQPDEEQYKHDKATKKHHKESKLNMTRKIPPIDLEWIRDQIENGKTAVQLAEYLGVSVKTIQRRSAVIGMRQELYENIGRQFRSERKELIKSLCLEYGAGFTMQQLCEETGIKSESLSPIVAELVECDEVEWKAYCETCNDKMYIFYSTGRFCSNICSRSYASSKVTEEGMKKKIAAFTSKEALSKRAEAARNNPHSKKNIIKRLRQNNKTLREAQKIADEVYSVKKESGIDGRKTTWTPEKRARHRDIMKKAMNNPETKTRVGEAAKRTWYGSSEEKRAEWRSNLSKAARDRVANGTHIGWTSRNIVSYPEQSWMKALDRAGVKYEHNYRVSKEPLDGTLGSYFLDFMIVNKHGEQLDFEVDGKQHEYPDRKAHDNIRDVNLQKAGFKIFRAKWHRHDKTDLIEQEKRKVEQYLTEFLERTITIEFGSAKE